MNDGGPAFPVQFGFVSSHVSEGLNDPIPDNARINIANGMSLRDWFAGQALMALIPLSMQSDPHTVNVNAVAAKAVYEFADAMLKARNG